MSSLFARVIKQVFKTFDQKNASAFKPNFAALKQLVDQLTPRDINIDTDIISEEAFQKPNKAPCTYVHIFQNEDVAISVFIVRGDYSMPLHDHPMMYGILKAIHGKLDVQSYSQILSDGEEIYNKSAKYVNVTAEPVKRFTNSTESAILTPVSCNFHEIRAVGGVAAFFDILSPPYDSDVPVYGKRNCNYYRKISKKDSPNEFILERIPPPPTYGCDTEDYDPPQFFYEHFIKYMSGRA